ncbi:MAG: class I SAM-dependent RNA methyltransferase [Deltaproteobacteria bacterium]|nr:class I SAM-dependent RNA methyltransferase [Deltaproteobacteria bacterium]
MTEAVVEITGLAYGGKGIGRIDGKVVFVPLTAPGDTARVRVTAEKKGFSEAVLLELLTASPVRKDPPCPVYGICGGCQLQHIKYSQQLLWKEKIFEETVKRIGKIEDITFQPPAGSPDEFNYRAKVRFQVKGLSWGFFEHASSRIVDVDECSLADPLVNAAYKRIKTFFMKEAGVPPALCSVEAGLSRRDGKVVASLGISRACGFDWERVLKAVDAIKGIEVWLRPSAGVFGGIHSGAGGGKRIVSLGDTRLLHDSCGVAYSSGISVFSQANQSLNPALVRKALEYAGLHGGERVVDLFAGAGNITLPAARLAKEAVGVEAGKEAVKNGADNAMLNSIVNARFMRADALEWIKSNMKRIEKHPADVVVLDPPRGGDLDVSTSLAQLKPKKIVYVSCSPPTLARDLAVFAEHGYRKFNACLFDMFPQTYHMECVVVMEQ